MPAATTAALFLAGLVLVIRFAAMDAKRWHIDPDEPSRTGQPNDYHLAAFGASQTGDAMAGVYDLPFESLCGILLSAALEEPRTTLLAGDVMLGHITIVQRSRLLGYPDAITIQTRPVNIPEQTATLSIYSRSRYGNGDFGVNRARVLRWLEQAAPFLSEPQPLP